EDYDLWLRISLKEKISFVDEPLAVYVKHAGNISNDELKTLEKWKFIIERYGSSTSKMKLLRKYVSFYKKAFRIQAVHVLKNIKKDYRIKVPNI
ncbi:MAG: hypothetical protein KJ864_06110, partial [Candidatus Omnitrophica bacterium]|nr:hypothetical protein [Candidatus Omnitrophota bacterium]